MKAKEQSAILQWRVRFLLIAFVVGLVLSGLTAVPLEREIEWLERQMGEGTWMERAWPGIASWISYVHEGIMATGRDYPFIAYGTDWLAFGHIMLAIAFVGAIKDPVRNMWVIKFGMIACALVIPWALVFGPVRGIPFWWRLIDCSFGVLGIIPLALAYKWVQQINFLRICIKLI